MDFPHIFARYLTGFRETWEQNSTGRHVTAVLLNVIVHSTDVTVVRTFEVGTLTTCSRNFMGEKKNIINIYSLFDSYAMLRGVRRRPMVTTLLSQYTDT
jgi:hypothetical protein